MFVLCVSVQKWASCFSGLWEWEDCIYLKVCIYLTSAPTSVTWQTWQVVMCNTAAFSRFCFLPVTSCRSWITLCSHIAGTIWRWLQWSWKHHLPQRRWKLTAFIIIIIQMIFPCRFRLNAPLLYSSIPFRTLACVYLCAYHGPAWHRSSSGSCSVTPPPCYIPDPKKQIGSKQIVTGNQPELLLDHVDKVMCWCSCVDYRCCTHFSAGTWTVFYPSNELCVVTHFLIFVIQSFLCGKSETADLS